MSVSTRFIISVTNNVWMSEMGCKYDHLKERKQHKSIFLVITVHLFNSGYVTAGKDLKAVIDFGKTFRVGLTTSWQIPLHASNTHLPDSSPMALMRSSKVNNRAMAPMVVSDSGKRLCTYNAMVDSGKMT